MGKRSREQKVDEQEVVNTENQKKKITKTELNNTSNEIHFKTKGIKKSKKYISGDDESSKNSVKSNKKNKHYELITNTSGPDENIPMEENNYDNCKKNKKKKRSIEQDEPNDPILQKNISIDKDKKIRKKRKLNVVAEGLVKDEHPSKELMIAKTKGNKKDKKIVLPKDTKKVNNDDELLQGSLNVTSKITKKKKQNVLHKEIEYTDNNDVKNKDKPKKKKKKKILEEEIADDEEIDKYCNELDEFCNKQYENWVKLIEENLNKNVKKYLV